MFGWKFGPPPPNRPPPLPRWRRRLPPNRPLSLRLKSRQSSSRSGGPSLRPPFSSSVTPAGPDAACAAGRPTPGGGEPGTAGDADVVGRRARSSGREGRSWASQLGKVGERGGGLSGVRMIGARAGGLVGIARPARFAARRVELAQMRPSPAGFNPAPGARVRRSRSRSTVEPFAGQRADEDARHARAAGSSTMSARTRGRSVSSSGRAC